MIEIMGSVYCFKYKNHSVTILHVLGVIFTYGFVIVNYQSVFINLNLPTVIYYVFLLICALYFLFHVFRFRKGRIIFNDTHIVIHANSRVYNVEYSDIIKTQTRGWYDYVIRCKEDADFEKISLDMSVSATMKEVDRILIERVNKANKGRKGFRRLTSNWNTPVV